MPSVKALEVLSRSFGMRSGRLLPVVCHYRKLFSTDADNVTHQADLLQKWLRSVQILANHPYKEDGLGRV